MHRTPHTRVLWLLTAALLVAAGGRVTWASAQEPGGLAGSAPQAQAVAYTLSWYTIDGGGSAPEAGPSSSIGQDAQASAGTAAEGPAAGGSASPYTLGATVGQPDAGTLAGGSYTLLGGFWAGAPPPLPGFALYLPVIIRFDS